MDEETIIKGIAIICVIILVLTFMSFNQLKILNTTAKEKLQCKQVIDDIYNSCREGGQTNISDIKGGSTTLKYENGVCIIK